jgi:hypothetical protein
MTALYQKPALFIDIDGTIVKHHTSEWLPGARERLIALSVAHRIIFMTMRGPQDAGTEWSVLKTIELLHSLPFKYTLLTSVGGPRTMIDDSEIRLLRTRRDSADWVNFHGT